MGYQESRYTTIKCSFSQVKLILVKFRYNSPKIRITYNIFDFRGSASSEMKVAIIYLGGDSEMTIRPQIIVLWRKSSAFAKIIVSESRTKDLSRQLAGESSNFGLSQNESSSSALNTPSDISAQNSSSSPSKSVIGHVGPSASLVTRLVSKLTIASH